VTKRMLFTGDLLTAEEARHVGLVDEIVDAADAEGRLATLTGVLAARSLLTQAATKSMVAAIVSRGHVPRSLHEHWNDVAAGATDGAEGVAAFVEKRAARFTWSGSGSAPDGE
jgi:enoyl-CoA hydratase/carnithine racemase